MTLNQILKSIDKKEWKFVLIISAVLIIITTIPFLYGYLNAPPGHFFYGYHSLTPGDFPVYFSYINQIKAGAFSLKNYFTSESQTSSIFNIFWLIIGSLARLFNLPASFAFQIVRILLIPVFCLTFYIFASYFFQEKIKRKITMIFAAFCSGLGAYFVVSLDKLFPVDQFNDNYKWPIDLWVPESNIFLSLYHSPLLIASLICLICFFLLMLLAWENNKYQYSLVAGLIGLIWFNFHPYYAPYSYIILFIFLLILLWRQKKIKYLYHYLLAVCLSLPAVFYHYYKIKTDYMVGLRAMQNQTKSPEFFYILIGFGFLFLLALLGICKLFKDKEIFKNEKMQFLLIWLGTVFALLYAPIFFQRRFLEGLQLPMIFLALIGLYYLKELLEQRAKKLFNFFRSNIIIALYLFLILFCLTNIFNLTRDFYYFSKRFDIFYLPNEFITSLNWLAADNKENKIILTSQFTGNLIPGLVNQRVYLGHGDETLDFANKQVQVNNFLSNNLNAEQEKTLIKANNIGYLFLTDLERRFYQAEDKKYWQEVLQEGEIEIYKFSEAN
ncbi:MAG: hypothetical protein A2Y67_04445 [Candidatus Buchananbacteria bacterium RBG_13_39_9]|uniref:Glycosyltransferase RgtA/B/C/D-like domain-containing protein n=1 Tax=Candidatus Buchananbacteria bacterium RBG_13_39_9 TaxID=1797531 RepID=A0A1G1XQL9_9BACT|nr:MAG: hypothetical protein A2Y67_04445 [Candidatus Buchananbacteria bacterium RBG_13_39_9]